MMMGIFFQGLLELLELVRNVGLKVNLLLLNEDEILKEKALQLFQDEVIYYQYLKYILVIMIFLPGD